jgi:hypothetical protein
VGLLFVELGTLSALALGFTLSALLQQSRKVKEKKGRGKKKKDKKKKRASVIDRERESEREREKGGNRPIGGRSFLFSPLASPDPHRWIETLFLFLNCWAERIPWTKAVDPLLLVCFFDLGH